MAPFIFSYAKRVYIHSSFVLSRVRIFNNGVNETLRAPLGTICFTGGGGLTVDRIAPFRAVSIREATSILRVVYRVSKSFRGDTHDRKHRRREHKHTGGPNLRYVKCTRNAINGQSKRGTNERVDPRSAAMSSITLDERCTSSRRKVSSAFPRAHVFPTCNGCKQQLGRCIFLICITTALHLAGAVSGQSGCVARAIRQGGTGG